MTCKSYRTYTLSPTSRPFSGCDTPRPATSYISLSHGTASPRIWIPTSGSAVCRMCARCGVGCCRRTDTFTRAWSVRPSIPGFGTNSDWTEVDS